MPLYALSELLDTTYFIPISILATLLLLLHTWSKGSPNDRERDLHGRTFIVTGGFTSPGTALLQSLAERGAQLIALHPSLQSETPQTLIPLIQTQTENPNVYAEECDLTSPKSIRAFVAKFVQGKNGTGVEDKARLDGLVFMHEYPDAQGDGDEGSLGTFLMTTLLLPSLVAAPEGRDIRILNVVNPWYASAIPSFDPATPTSKIHSEGTRSLRSILFARHTQRVLDALASPPVPEAETETEAQTLIRKSGSNIKCMTACPGYTLSETIRPWLGFLSTFLLFIPITKSSTAAIQTPLYTLFLPHPTKLPAKTKEESIRGGELYRECKVVRLPSERGAWLAGEEKVGRAVWEWFEGRVKAWEEGHKDKDGDGEGKGKGKGKEKDDEDVRESLKGLKGKFKES